MKRSIYAVLAAIISIVVTYYLLRFLWQWYEPKYVKSDSDISNFLIAGLVIQAICMIGTGIATYKLTGRRRSE